MFLLNTMAACVPSARNLREVIKREGDKEAKRETKIKWRKEMEKTYLQKGQRRHVCDVTRVPPHVHMKACVCRDIFYVRVCVYRCLSVCICVSG